MRKLPSVSRLLSSPVLVTLEGRVPAGVLSDAARQVLSEARSRIQDGKTEAVIPDIDDLAQQAAREAIRRHQPSLVRAINATGILLHTGLGRARLANAAVAALLEVAGGHSSVEIDRETGRRGARQDHVRDLLCELTGAEDAMVVNNCAGAVFLTVAALSAGREAVISRGELVEIGGAFRMPDIIRAGGAVLVEVGTTNRTRLSDYAAAITERTGIVIRCHPSNFAQVGFTEETPSEELAALCHEKSIPFLEDQGSGAYFAPDQLGIPGAGGTLAGSLLAGGDIITASGDKLLGGPQAGLILGRSALIERIGTHPLARALRVDKLTLAALEATLRLCRDPERARHEIPTLRYLTRTLPEIRRLAVRLQRQFRAALPAETFDVGLVAEHSQVGGGSLPGQDLPTYCVTVRARFSKPSPDTMAAAFRRHTPPVFGRIHADTLLFDPRTLEPEEIAIVAAAARAIPG